MGIIYVYHSSIEDLFDRYSTSIWQSGGDGASAIVCKNYRETAKYYEDWLEKQGLGKYLPEREEYENTVNFHDLNENHIFTNDINIQLSEDEYVFVVEIPLVSINKNGFIIEPIEE